VRIRRSDEEGRERLSRYILRDTFSVEKLAYVEETGHIISQFKMTHGKNRKNFEVYEAKAFIAAITQHIVQKSFQMVN
jgi:DTW domain-containing protein YfiP